MAVLREWRCTFHDIEFESFDNPATCPYGCDPSMVVMEFRTAPSIRSTHTRHADAWMRQLASDYNLTDMHNDKDGGSVMSNTRASSGGAKKSPDKAQPYWSGSMFPVQHGWAGRNEPAPVFKPPSTMACAATPIRHINVGASAHLQTATRFVKPKEGSK